MTLNSDARPVVIIGAGPAGLTAAHELLERSSEHRPVVFEALDKVGGISRTESRDGYRFDIGGHRFFTKVPEVSAFWAKMLGPDFIKVKRLSRIHYRGKFFAYPLKPLNALRQIGLVETFRVLLSLLRWRLFPYREEETFTQWVTNRFGRRLYLHFFHTYTRKIWGTPPEEIRADWAAQRIQGLSLWRAITDSLGWGGKLRSLIEEFDYPRLGPGQMWETCAARVQEMGGQISLNHKVVGLKRDGARVTSVGVQPTGAADTDPVTWVAADQVISSTDLRGLLHLMDPPPPPEVLAAAHQLRYRDFLIVTLILDHPDPFPDNWIYIHTDVKVGRIQNFRAWSPDMVPDPKRSSIGMEYFCQEDDALWSLSDEALRALAAQELETLGLARAETVVQASVIRQPKAYPVYDTEYRAALDVIRPWIEGLENFQTVGRNGLHRYNNQDHSMLSAMYAAGNILGERHDLWEVNLERSYHEEFELAKSSEAQTAKLSARPSEA